MSDTLLAQFDMLQDAYERDWFVADRVLGKGAFRHPYSTSINACLGLHGYRNPIVGVDVGVTIFRVAGRGSCLIFGPDDRVRTESHDNAGPALAVCRAVLDVVDRGSEHVDV